MSLLANVAVQFMRLLALSLDAAQEENCVASDVKPKLSGLARRTFVAITVMQCRRCKEERKRIGKTPRDLVRLPPEVTQDPSFKRKGLPVSLCEGCDGAAVDLALSTHSKRTGI